MDLPPPFGAPHATPAASRQPVEILAASTRSSSRTVCQLGTLPRKVAHARERAAWVGIAAKTARAAVHTNAYEPRDSRVHALSYGLD